MSLLVVQINMSYSTFFIGIFKLDVNFKRFYNIEK